MELGPPYYGVDNFSGNLDVYQSTRIFDRMDAGNRTICSP
jgi:hypothetical protein